MKSGDKFEHLAEYLSAVEGSGFEVTEVTAHDEEEGLEADLTVRIPIAAAVSGDGVDVTVETAERLDGGAVGAELALRVPDGTREDPADSGSGEAERPSGDEPGNDPAGRGTDVGERADGSDESVPDPDSGRQATGTGAGSADEEAGVEAPVGSDGGPPTDPAEGADDPEAGGDDESPAEGEDDTPTKNVDDPPTDDTDATGDHDPETPAYRDPERLRAVYEAEDTFEAMTEALGVDVTPQTVRRHMIRNDIHDVAGRSGSGDGGSEGGDDADPSSADGSTDGRRPDLTRADGSTGSAGNVNAETNDGDDGDRSWPTESDDGAGEAGPGDGEADGDPTGGGPDPVADDEADPAEADPAGADDGEGTDADTDGVKPNDPIETRGDGGTESVDTGEGAESDGTATTSGADPGEDVASGAGDATDEFEDLDLPEGVGIEDVRASVRTAQTLYDVQRDLGLDRERTRSVLERLDLLDLVHGRVSRLDEETPIEEIDERIAATAGDPDRNSRESAGD